MQYLTTLISPQTASIVFLIISIFFILLWASIVFWTYQDVNLRTRNQLLFTVSLLAVVCIPIAGVVFYFFIRPANTLEEQQTENMERLLMLKEIKEKPSCNYCGETVEKTFVACPYCHKKIRTICKSCGKVIELDWDLCPYCATRQKITDSKD